MSNCTSLHHWTPLIYSMPLSKLTGKNIWLKMEAYQPAGSFKIRGIGRLCQYYQRHGAKRFVSSSGGNAGLAVAYAGRMLQIPTHVFIPKTSKQIYIDAITAEGADVKIAGDYWDQADKTARAYAEQEQGAYVPPFDHPLIWAGHATMVDEIIETGVYPDAIMTAVGGGGLACGVLAGLHQHGWDDVTLLGVETEGAASFAACMNTKAHIKLDCIDTIATSLGAAKIATQLYGWIGKHPMQSIVVSDDETLTAIHYFADAHRVLIEPSSATTIAAALNGYITDSALKNIIIIVCGGVGISCDMI